MADYFNFRLGRSKVVSLRFKKPFENFLWMNFFTSTQQVDLNFEILWKKFRPPTILVDPSSQIALPHVPQSEKWFWKQSQSQHRRVLVHHQKTIKTRVVAKVLYTQMFISIILLFTKCFSFKTKNKRITKTWHERNCLTQKRLLQTRARKCQYWGFVHALRRTRSIVSRRKENCA